MVRRLLIILALMAVSCQAIAQGYLSDANLPLGSMYFRNLSYTLTIAAPDSPYTKITNLTTNLFTVKMANNITCVGDTFSCLYNGTYIVEWHFVFAGVNTRDYRIRVAKNGSNVGGGMSGTSTGLTNYQEISGTQTLDSLKVGDDVHLEMMGIGTGDDPVLRDGSVLIYMRPRQR